MQTAEALRESESKTGLYKESMRVNRGTWQMESSESTVGKISAAKVPSEEMKMDLAQLGQP